MSKINVGCEECGHNFKIDNEKSIKKIDDLIDKLSAGDTFSEYKRGYIDAIIDIKDSIL